MTTSTPTGPQISDELRKIYDAAGGDLSQVAARLGLPIDELKVPTSVPVLHTPRRRTVPADIGRPELRKHIVSVRHANTPQWPISDLSKIDDARAKYEAGTHEMCQGRDRDWFVLYLIPRRQRCGARKFFTGLN